MSIVGDTESASVRRSVNVERMAKIMFDKRQSYKLTLEDVQKQTGLSIATLSRFERLRHYNQERKEGIRPLPEPDANTLIAVSRWLGISLDSVMHTPNSNLIDLPNETPDVVEAHLRADKNLSPQAIQALSTLFRAAYDQFSSQPVTESD